MSDKMNTVTTVTAYKNSNGQLFEFKQQADESQRLLELESDLREFCSKYKCSGSQDSVVDVLLEEKSEMLSIIMKSVEIKSSKVNSVEISIDRIMEIVNLSGIASTDYVDMYSCHQMNLIEFVRNIEKELLS